MATEKFIASVQYGDWKGTSAADGADRNGLRDWLEANGHKKSDEFLFSRIKLQTPVWRCSGSPEGSSRFMLEAQRYPWLLPGECHVCPAWAAAWG